LEFYPSRGEGPVQGIGVAWKWHDPAVNVFQSMSFSQCSGNFTNEDLRPQVSACPGAGQNGAPCVRVWILMDIGLGYGIMKREYDLLLRLALNLSTLLFRSSLFALP